MYMELQYVSLPCGSLDCDDSLGTGLLLTNAVEFIIAIYNLSFSVVTPGTCLQ